MFIFDRMGFFCLVWWFSFCLILLFFLVLSVGLLMYVLSWRVFLSDGARFVFGWLILFVHLVCVLWVASLPFLKIFVFVLFCCLLLISVVLCWFFFLFCLFILFLVLLKQFVSWFRSLTLFRLIVYI